MSASAGRHTFLSAGGDECLMDYSSIGPISVLRGAGDGGHDCSRYAAQDHSNHQDRVQFG